jgi:predicted nuclease with TOPRIM domain
MRDIRDDLRQRVQFLKDERDALQKQLTEKLAELDAYEAQLSSLLAFEEKRANGAAAQGQRDLAESGEAAEESVEGFEEAILAIMGNYQPWTHSDIKLHLQQEQWSAEKGSLGRLIQGQLLSMKQRGLIEFLGDRKWRRLKVAVAA